MKHQYIVAENAFTVSVPEGFSTWEALEPAFHPFAAAASEKPVLAISITSGAIPPREGERIYEPVHSGIGYFNARASRLDDGSTVMEFKHIFERKTRLWMKMPAGLDEADIIVSPEGEDEENVAFLTHAMMVAFMLATCHTGTVLIHSSAVLYDGKAYLFQGKSGTGKSTHAAMWIANIAGAEQLNDDSPAIRFAPDGTARAYGSPWSGKTHYYRNLSAPIGGMVRIVRADRNELQRLTPIKAYASLTASVFYIPFLSDELREVRHKTIERLATTLPCCEMHCRPDADAALTCMRGLTQSSNEQN